MNIQRINTYDDSRFKKEVLHQHGAYIVDEMYPCEFYITGYDQAIMFYHDYKDVDEIIDEFRFYSKHVTKFYDEHNNLIKEFHDITIKKYPLEDLQPSQFFIDELKLQSIASWAKEPQHFVVPVMNTDQEIIILDGHTRLYLAYQLGIKEIYVYEDSVDDYIYEFVKEAQNRNIHSIKDLQCLTHETYKIKWHKYCDDFFKSKQIE